MVRRASHDQTSRLYVSDKTGTEERGPGVSFIIRFIEDVQLSSFFFIDPECGDLELPHKPNSSKDHAVYHRIIVHTLLYIYAM